MKKTLAILLALLAAASITLASCEKKDQPNNDGWDDEDNEYVDTDDDDGNDTTNDNNDDTTNDQNPGNNDNDTPTNPSGWVEKNDTVYAGVLLTLRDEPNGDSIDEIPFGTALSRAETNGTWDKVTYNNKTGYVMHVLVASTDSAFKFTNVETPVAITVNPENTNNVVLYKSPFYIDDSDLSSANWLCKSGIKPNNLSETYTMKKLAISENKKWVKVEFVGTVTISSNNTATYTAENPGIFYIQATSFNDGRIVDSTWSSGGNNDSGAIG